MIPPPRQRTETIGQEHKRARDFAKIQLAPLLVIGAEIDGQNRAHPRSGHDIDRHVVKDAAVDEEIVSAHDRRKNARDRHAREEGAFGLAVAVNLFAGAGVVAADAEKRQPHFLDASLAERFRQNPIELSAGQERDERKEIEIARRIGQKRAFVFLVDSLPIPPASHAGRQDRADACPAEEIYGHARFLERAKDADVSQPARPAAGENQAHRLTTQEARQPRHVFVVSGAQMIMPLHIGPPGQKAERALGPFSSAGMKQDHRLPDAPHCPAEAGLLHLAQFRRSRRRRQQQNFIRLAQAAPRPFRRRAIRLVKNERVTAFHFIQIIDQPVMRLRLLLRRLRCPGSAGGRVDRFAR